jgi:hypothetical protein
MTSVIRATEDAAWRPLYEHARLLDYGVEIDYSTIEDILDFDIRDRGRWVVTRTDRELQRHDQKALLNVRRVGYRIALPAEHEMLIRQRQRRSRRQVHKGVQVGRATNLSMIDEAARRRISDLTDHMAAVEARIAYAESRNQEKFARLEEQLTSSATTLERRLELLEKLVGERST